MKILYLNQDPKPDERVPEYDEKTGSTAVTQIIADINDAVSQRLVASDNIVDIRQTVVLPGANRVRLLAPTESTKYDFAEFTFFFRDPGFFSGKDTAGLFPLQGVQGVAKEGAIKLIGTKTTNNQSAKLQFSDWTSINEITTFYSEAREARKFPNYHRRIIGFFIDGMNGDTAQQALLVPSSLGDVAFNAPQNPTPANRLAAFKSEIDNYNSRNGSFVIGNFVSRPALSLLPNPNSPERRRIVNAAAHQFDGNSSSYLDSFIFYSGQKQSAISFNADNVHSVEFALDFEPVVGEGDQQNDTGAYEMSFLASNTDSDVSITQSTNGVTVNLPPVLFGIGGTTSPLSFNHTNSKTNQKSNTVVSQVAEKLTMKLPKVYYRVRSFTSVPVEAVRAQITITEKSTAELKPNSKLLVPLGQKVILADGFDGVSQAIVRSI